MLESKQQEEAATVPSHVNTLLSHHPVKTSAATCLQVPSVGFFLRTCPQTRTRVPWLQHACKEEAHDTAEGTSHLAHPTPPECKLELPARGACQPCRPQMAVPATPTPGPLTFWWVETSSLLLPSSSASFTFSSFSAESCWDFCAAACFRVSLQGQWVRGDQRNKTGKETVGDERPHSTGKIYLGHVPGRLCNNRRQCDLLEGGAKWH